MRTRINRTRRERRHVFIVEIWQIHCKGKQNQHLNQKLKKAGMLVASSCESYRWIPISQIWLTDRTRRLPLVLQDGMGVHLLCMSGMHGHHRQASLPILSHRCTHVTFEVPEGRNAPFCFARPIGEVPPMSTSCLTLKKTSPSHTDSIARRSSGHGAVFLGWEVFMYTYAGRNIQFCYKYIYVCNRTFRF